MSSNKIEKVKIPILKNRGTKVMLRAAREIRSNYYLVPLLELSPPIYAALDWALLNAGSPLQKQQKFLAFLLREYSFNNLHETFNVLGDPISISSSRAKTGEHNILLKVFEYKSTASSTLTLEFVQPNFERTELSWSCSTSPGGKLETFVQTSSKENHAGFIVEGPNFNIDQQRFFAIFDQFS